MSRRGTVLVQRQRSARGTPAASATQAIAATVHALRPSYGKTKLRDSNLARDTGLAAVRQRICEFRDLLVSVPTATQLLNQWCASGLAPPMQLGAATGGSDGVSPLCKATGRIRARVLDRGMWPVQRPDRGDIAWRRVELLHAGLPVSVATILYAPGRLPEASRVALDTTDTPFGEVIAHLEPHRIITKSQILSTLEPDRLSRPALLVRATVHLATGKPVARVQEHYLGRLFEC